MRNRYRCQVALVLVTCLPCTPAWGASATDFPEVQAAPADGLGASFPGTAPDIPADWNLAEIGAATEQPTLLAALPSSLPQDPARYGPAADAVPAASPEPAAGPPAPLDPSGHVPREFASHHGFFEQAGSSTTEIALLSGYVLAQGIPKLFKPTTGFHFKDEGWFGKDTQNVGMDKLTHAFNTYLIAELLHHRIHRNTGGSEGDALTAGILASGLMALNEISDAIEPDSGYSMQDIVMNITGATFSILRNTVPGLKEKLAFKIEIMPNHQIYSTTGKPHYEQQRFMFSLKGAGFEKLENSALKYLDLQVGYYASDFLNSDRDKGITPKRHLFVGVGLNLGELLFAKSGSRIGRAAYSVLDYVQLPYTGASQNLVVNVR
ncbi:MULTISPECIES: DUF2279 domain-containing protein [unclassified Novosphingobium]|uniref:DUF2279 domain-containing protein n=1 Tax=unclassified Novosphingobium TaxID=2644732 RepID=UPI00135AAF03|nr:MULTISPECIES: DUF2279 domain-containing protein [unclassified Novosphingobium]